MAADFTMKQHDTAPTLTVTLSDEDGPVSLATASTVKMFARSGSTLVTATMTKDPDQVVNKGKASYPWIAADTAVVGYYDVEFQVLWGDGDVQTFPNNGYKVLSIVQDLGT